MSFREEFLSQCRGVDFETSSLDHNTAEIIEQGISAYKDGEWNILHSKLHNCSVEIPPDSAAVHNIVSEMVANEPLFSQRLFHIDEGNPGILLSHNARFDMGVLKKYIDHETYEKLCENWLCTLRMIKLLHVNDTTFTKFNLSYLRYRLKFNVKVDIAPHRAGYDAYICGHLMEYIVDELERRELLDTTKAYLPQIKEWILTPMQLELMTFGKHARKPIKGLDTQYLEWTTTTDKLNENSPEFDEDLYESIYAELYRRSFQDP